MATKKSKIAIAFLLMLTMVSFFSLPATVFADDDNTKIILHNDQVSKTISSTIKPYVSFKDTSVTKDLTFNSGENLWKSSDIENDLLEKFKAIRVTFTDGSVETYNWSGDYGHKTSTKNIIYNKSETKDDIEDLVSGNTINFWLKIVKNPPTTCTVTFDSNGGTPVSSKSVTSGSAVGALINSTTTGAFTFGGWFTSSNVHFIATSIVSSNINVHAHWTPITYTVTFDGNGGSAVSPITVPSGSVVGTLAPSTTTSAFTFVGWFTSLNGGSQFTATSTVSNNITVYAHWAPIEAPINLWVAADDYADVYVNGAYVVNTPDPGWGTITTSLVDVANNPFIAAMGKDLHDVIAGFKLVFKNSDATYLATNSGWFYYTGNEEPPIDDNGLDWNDKDYQAAEGWNPVTTITVPHTNWVVSGFPASANWIWSPNFIADVNAIDTPVYFRSAAPTQITYTVNFIVDGTQVDSKSGIISGNNLGADMPSNPTPATNYSFDGWFTDSTGGTEFTSTTAVTATIDVYAQWTYTGPTDGGPYTVIFMVDGVEYTSIAGIESGSNATPFPGNPTTETALDFIGWYPEVGYVFTSDTPVYDNITVFARWNTPGQPPVEEEITPPVERQHHSIIHGDITPPAPPVVEVAEVIEPEIVPAGPVLIPVIDEPVPAAPLPKTGGLDPGFLYGLGALLAGSGLVIKRRKDK